MVLSAGHVDAVLQDRSWNVYVRHEYLGQFKDNDSDERRLIIKNIIQLELTRGDLKNLQLLFNQTLGGTHDF